MLCLDTAARTTAVFSPVVDVVAFTAPIAAAVVLSIVAALTRAPHDGIPFSWYLLVVVAFDVAHVWTTLFMCYLDTAENNRRWWLYNGAPLVLWLVLVTLFHVGGEAVFWSSIGYFAIYHFAKQQYGLLALAKGRCRDFADGVATLAADRWWLFAGAWLPILSWHLDESRRFDWFNRDDLFVHKWLSRRVLKPAVAALLDVRAMCEGERPFEGSGIEADGDASSASSFTATTIVDQLTNVFCGAMKPPDHCHAGGHAPASDSTAPPSTSVVDWWQSVDDTTYYAVADAAHSLVTYVVYPAMAAYLAYLLFIKRPAARRRKAAAAATTVEPPVSGGVSPFRHLPTLLLVYTWISWGVGVLVNHRIVSLLFLNLFHAVPAYIIAFAVTHNRWKLARISNDTGTSTMLDLIGQFFTRKRHAWLYL